MRVVQATAGQRPYEERLAEVKGLLEHPAFTVAHVCRLIGRDTLSRQEYVRMVLRGDTKSSPVVNELLRFLKSEAAEELRSAYALDIAA